MKKAIILLSVPAVLLSACGTESDPKSTKGSWTNADRKEFMHHCILSAKKTYEQRGLQPDSAVINCMCRFSSKSIEEKYTYADANKVTPAEIEELMASAAKSCLINE